jgi:two-component system sensor histidine kinase GlrK
MIDNLLTNAIKFSPPQAVLTLRVGVRAQSLVFEVQDQGPGIASGEEERIFELFYQGKNRPQAPVPGSGLGLAIAREMALLHGGRLELAGSGPGACFRLTLPLQPVVSISAEEPAHA